MKWTMRRYRDESDYWRIREFLRRVQALDQLHQFSWPVARLDYWRWHGIENCRHCDAHDRVIFIWETSAEEMVAVLNPEERGEVFLQVHPAFRIPALEEEMLGAAEAHLTASTQNGKRMLNVWTDANDAARHNILTRRGYIKTKHAEYQRRRALSVPIPDVPIPQGYTVRALGNKEEWPARSWLSWQAFHPAEPDENYEGWEWYHNIQRIPLYRRDLDLVAVAPSGEFASFCTIWYDDVTRSACFEPVGTAPAHQRRGLGKAVMSEGLRRVERLGATTALVGSYSFPAHALYESVGFTEYDLSEAWRKELYP